MGPTAMGFTVIKPPDCKLLRHYWRRTEECGPGFGPFEDHAISPCRESPSNTRFYTLGLLLPEPVWTSRIRWRLSINIRFILLDAAPRLSSVPP